MKTRTPLLIACLTGCGLVSSFVFAQETADEEPGIVPDAFISEPIYSDIELGIGYVADDAYFFGRYNGLQTEGPYLIGDIDAEKFNEDGRFWNIRGTNLGLESRYLRLEGGKQGRHKFFLEWDELPNYMNNTGFTPFQGVGGDNLTLPSGFDIGPPVSDLFSLERETKRERIKAGAGFVVKQRWLFDVDFSHENKTGVDAIGGAIGSSVQNTNASLLPQPIDQDTNLVNATVRYAGDNGQLDLKYHASIFDNNFASLTWQDPFNPTTGTGSLALAPDNEFHQLSLTGGYTLPYKTLLTGVGSIGRMTQNEQFQPYWVSGSTADLPTPSLDGEVWLLNGQLKLASRPTTKLRLNAGLQYEERDNQTPVVQSFNYVIMDSGTVSPDPVENNPYSHKKNRFNIDANYRFNAISSLRGGYKYEAIERSRFNAGREETDENTLFAKLKIKPHATVDFELYGETGSRDGSEFDQQGYQDSLMRKYNLADRDRTKVGGLINVMATDRLFIGASADYSEDDYTNTQIGLTEASQPTVTVDFTYAPLSNLTTYGYYTWENIQSSQNGNDVSGSSGGGGGGSGTPGTPGPWQADFDDRFDTIGVGGRWTDLGKWDLGADVVYSKAIGNIEMKHSDPAITVNQFPDNKTELVSIKLYTDYHYSKQLSYKLGYWYEEYIADNWVVDGLVPYNPDVVANTLLLGEQTMDYEVRVVTVSASYKFQ